MAGKQAASSGATVSPVDDHLTLSLAFNRDAATRRDLFRDLSERLTETYYRQPALVDDDDAAATQARRDSTAEWDLEALGEPELARTTTPLLPAPSFSWSFHRPLHHRPQAFVSSCSWLSDSASLLRMRCQC